MVNDLACDRAAISLDRVRELVRPRVTNPMGHHV